MTITTKNLDGSYTVEEVPDLFPTVIQYSKLEVGRALRRRGIEDAFYAALDQYPPAKRDWYLAQVLQSDDQILTQMLPAFANALGISMDVVQQILNESRTT